MADFIDNIVDNAQDVNESVMEGLRNNPEVDAPSNKFCEECEDEIPEGRRKRPGIKLCVSCQTFKEKHPTLKFTSTGKVIKQQIVD